MWVTQGRIHFFGAPVIKEIINLAFFIGIHFRSGCIYVNNYRINEYILVSNENELTFG